jgi:hypothetical protein
VLRVSQYPFRGPDEAGTLDGVIPKSTQVPRHSEANVTEEASNFQTWPPKG